MTVRTILLAAGLGTRMRSALPKMMHPLCGRPMVRIALDIAAAVSPEKPVLVVGHGADAVRAEAGERAECIVQTELLGTADAVRRAEGLLRGRAGHILVFYGDMPLWRPETLRRLAEAGQQGPGPMAMLTGVGSDARLFGRVIRDAAGAVREIVEDAHLSPEQRAVKEVNLGAYCFRAEWLWEALGRVKPSPKGEYYLTDLVSMAAQEGGAAALEVEDEEEWIGINTRAHLAEAEAALRRRINRRWMEAGVGLQDPATTYISLEATIGEDTRILANTHIEGKTAVGRGCVIGPNSILRNMTVGDRCRVECSVVENAVMEEESNIGPFGHLRSGSRLERGAHMGNFGEMKNSRLGAGAKMGHFSYLGDATVGPSANIGAGTITCNYDGKQKHPTEIGEGAFIGSDSMLVAPVKIGRGAKTGAGSVVTHDVPDGGVVVGVPARTFKKKAARKKNVRKK
ncbi:MAG: bifunctional UDP-N-acetylglucosamine diphosphorylase/glucosamine-1-phosphate N-acetyltransferase GlmU [Anaerolineales bacterium]|nr:bifunctional UDP-N-acetylglucosamine diphosphorylase/glucosamine-1-phosphate N-acetyltransferase GlmU [Anaerolineales bacterium]